MTKSLLGQIFNALKPRPLAVKKSKPLQAKPDLLDRYLLAEKARKAAGSVDGKHYTEHVEGVKALKRSGNHDAAAALLLQLLSAVEAESRVAGPAWPLAPWYYEQLAIIYRQAKRYSDEVEVLERYIAQHKTKSEPPMAAIVKRLEKARSLKEQQR